MKNRKEDIKKIMEVSGEVRRVVFQTDAEYVQMVGGKEAVRRLQEETGKLGYPINYNNIQATEWAPIGLRVVSLLAAQNAFNWGEKEIYTMGKSAPKHSFLAKTMMRYFFSPQQSIKETPKYWSKHYTVGEFEVVEFHEKKKFFIFRLKNFNIHPIMCHYLKGYFLTVCGFIVKSEQMEINEEKCIFRGDPYHEFIVKWQ